MIPLSTKQKSVHEQAKLAGRAHRRAEHLVVEALIQVEATHLNRSRGKTLYAYALEEMGLTEATAYAMIAVARKAKELPVLREALMKQEISCNKAGRIVAALNKDNVEELIEFAKTHTSLETDFEVGRINPKVRKRDKIKIITEDDVQVTVTLTKQDFSGLKRLQSIEAQKGNDSSLSAAVGVAIRYYLSKNDPVQKAERSARDSQKSEKSARSKDAGHKVRTEKGSMPKYSVLPTQANNPAHASGPNHSFRASNKTVCTYRISVKKRVPLTAAQKHAVTLRDGGRCTFHDSEGRRCHSDRFLDTHHILEVQRGGTNDLENLATLCKFHHDFVHQLKVPIDGQINWQIRRQNKM